MGALLSLGGCVLGNLMSGCGFVAIHEKTTFFHVLGLVLGHPAAAGRLLGLMFQPIDLLFYGIALYEGYRFSFRRIDWHATAKALAARQHQPPAAK